VLISLKDKSVIVTGGTKGIGRGITKVLAGLGAQVCVIGRNEHDGVVVMEALRGSGGTVKFCRGDVKEQADMEKAAATVAAEFGGLDILCANAGIFPQAKLEELTESTWDEVFATNLKGMLFSIQACLPYLKRSVAGRIILTSSTTGPLTGVVFQFGSCALSDRTTKFRLVHIQSNEQVVHDMRAGKTQRLTG
jgi:3-oxoacyl-[acyl-carrier protein] reductase